MQAYKNDAQLKQDLLAEIKRHQEADMLTQGTYVSDDGKYCAVGCAIHSLKITRGIQCGYNDHGALAKELEIDTALMYLQDAIFENLNRDDAFKFPYEFASAVRVGADTSKVMPKFLVYILSDEKFGVQQYANDETKKIIDDVVALYRRVLHGETIDAAIYAAADAADAAYAAVHAADTADAAYAADTADAAYAARAAICAARAAICAARAADAAYAAVHAAYAAVHAADAADAGIWRAYRDKLLGLLNEV